jgi:hypothetical protein
LEDIPGARGWEAKKNKGKTKFILLERKTGGTTQKKKSQEQADKHTALQGHSKMILLSDMLALCSRL